MPTSRKRIRRQALSWAIGLGLTAVRCTCRIHRHRDTRMTRRRDGGTYIFAALHAHQIGSAMCGDTDIGAMVSRSGDGEIIVPMLKMMGIRPIRGSSGGVGKGGRAAMTALIRHVRDGGAAYLAVDGPAGPRGLVHRGVSMLAGKTDVPVFAVCVVPRRRWILKNTWDRLQIPKPFTRIDVYFSRPMFRRPEQSREQFAVEIQDELAKLERWYDPVESHVVAINSHTGLDANTDSTDPAKPPNDSPAREILPTPRSHDQRTNVDADRRAA